MVSDIFVSAAWSTSTYRQTTSDDEQRGTEATERGKLGAGPEHESTNAVNDQTSDESPSEPKLADNPTAPRQGTDKVSTKVGCLKTASSRSSHVQVDLEFCIERIEQAVATHPVSISLRT